MVEIVAEISGNHGGSLKKMIEMITIAANRLDNDPRTACDYVKFQLYRPEDMPDRHEGYNEEMYRKLMVPDEWLEDLFKVARELSIGLFASVFSMRALKTLLQFDVPYIKFAAPSSTRLPEDLYYRMSSIIPASVGLIVSSNEADRPSLEGLPYDHLLYCPGSHPPELTFEDLGLISSKYTGFSDHTNGIKSPLAAIRAGATMIEKHFKIDDNCVDAAFSADPHTMRLLCRLAHNR